MNIIALVDEESRFPKVACGILQNLIQAYRIDLMSTGISLDFSLPDFKMDKDEMTDYMTTCIYNFGCLYEVTCGAFVVCTDEVTCGAFFFISQGSDATMLQKINTHHKRSKLFLPPVNSTSSLFGIRHFAGTVYYSSKGKNLITAKKPVLIDSDGSLRVSLGGNQVVYSNKRKMIITRVYGLVNVCW